MKKVLSLLMALVLLISLVACGSGKNSIVGEWYNDDGKCLDIRSDGSWKLEDSYGTGTWKELDDGEYEFTDFYSDTQKSAINKDANGEFIDFGIYGNFYRNGYPSTNENSDNKRDDESSVTEDVEKIALNPFEGLEFEVSGISPYCKITINNSKCETDVQKFVTYKTDKDLYANGEVALITAVLSTKTGDKQYKINQENIEYEITGQSEYLTSLDGIDLSSIKTEVEDALAAEKASISDSDSIFTMDAYDAGGTNIKSCDKITAGDVYFSSLKEIRNSSFVLGRVPYNVLTFTYAVDYTWIGYYVFDQVEQGAGTMYLTVNVQNIVKHSDGHISWGTSATEGFDLTYSHSQKGMDDLISVAIMSNSTNYNIEKMDE